MAMANRYRTHSDSSSDDESDDSDKECLSWKRAVKRKYDEETLENNQEQEMVAETEPKLKKKRNNIWSDIMQDQIISEDLGSCLLKNKPADFYDRGHESYDYTLKYTDPRNKRSSDVEMSDGDSLDADKQSVSSHMSGQSNTYVKLDSKEKEVVWKINRVLNEKKVYLLCRVVKFLGIDKATSLLKRTEDIEESGGMMIANHSRRRTPGGVFIQLIKTDKDIPKETIDKIFEGEMNPLELKKHFQEINKQKKKHKKKAQMKKSLSEPLLETGPKKNLDTSSATASKESEGNTEAVMDEIEPTPSALVTPKNPGSDLEDGEISD